MSPRTEHQLKEYKQEVKETILSSSMKLFAQKGYAGTSVSDIIEMTKMSRGLLYHYFSGKEEVYIALVQQAVQHSAGLFISASNQNLSPVETLSFLTKIMITQVISDQSRLYPFLIVLQTFISDEVPEKAKEIVQSDSTAISYVRTLFEQMLADKHINIEGSPKTLSTLYWAVIHGLVVLRLSDPVNIALPDYTDVLRLFGVLD